ncbi:unnamed protein product [Rotaria sp. Silwood2]|nr:unnamed protein product [Rotaria sp. Silwood2]CAF2915078.1 unnamed protein product [Rotaria sp. Silwood2]CAF3409610.1 unnamed protein product [Rotaria sp. Silwood2]CAF4434780.1 unnamed protein product [Rotaria sp. Silwood2]CAF4456150.1 unnamed protein product [Rotaria sp. Silwood2]
MHQLLPSVLIIAIIGVINGDKCGQNCLYSDCPSTCPCGTKANYVSAASYCSQYTDWNQQCCECIVQAESKGNANAMNYNRDGTWDIGLFQINQRNFASCNSGQYPCGPQQNLACARKVWQWGGKTFKLWATVGQCNRQLGKRCG